MPLVLKLLVPAPKHPPVNCLSVASPRKGRDVNGTPSTRYSRYHSGTTSLISQHRVHTLEYLIARVQPPHSTAAPAVPPRNGDGSACPSPPSRERCLVPAKDHGGTNEASGFSWCTVLSSHALVDSRSSRAIRHRNSTRNPDPPEPRRRPDHFSVAHDGDPFTATVAEPVFSGNQLILPAGTKVHGTVTALHVPNGLPWNAAALR